MQRWTVLSRRVLAPAFVASVLVLALVSPMQALAQAAPAAATDPAASRPAVTDQPGHAPAPIKTGTATGGVEAGESNDEMEQFTHSSTVASWGKKLGLSTNQASRYFEDFNAFVLIAVILFYLLKIVPGKFREKKATITRDLGSARAETANAQERLKAIEAKLHALGGEVEALRTQAATQSAQDETRMQATIEHERERIVKSAHAEIVAAQANAERGLKRYASDLAVDRAAEQVRLTPEGDRALVDEFLTGLATELGRQGRN